MKTHRIGTVTLGIILVVFGVLFMLRIFINAITYELIFNLWPAIFVLLGIEVLIKNFLDTEGKLIYDKGAVFLIIVLSFFAMGMAGMQFIFEHCDKYMISLY